MGLIGIHNIKNASCSNYELDISRLRFSDIKDGMIVNICEDYKDNNLYLVVNYDNIERDLTLNISREDHFKMYLLTKDNRNSQGFNYWTLDLWDKKFPNHNEWGDQVKITRVWNTKINTNNLDLNSLNKIFNDLENIITI